MNTDKPAEGKENEYAKIIIGKIMELFDEDFESDFHISKDEIEQGNNATDFLHALSNLAPNYIYYHLSGDEKNSIEFNHIANQLVFQYALKENKKEENE